MSAADALATWRARAEAELSGAPLRSLVPRRTDGLSIQPLEVADAAREEGLGSRPAHRTIALVVDARSLAQGEAFVDGVDVLWFRGTTAPVTVSRLPVLIEPTERDFDRASLGDRLVLSDAATEQALGATGRPWDARDAISSVAIHEAGAGPVTEVAFLVAAMLDRRRAIGAARPPAFATAVSPEIFVEISKLRALRRLADRVLATVGEVVGVPIHARSDERSSARLDRPTNAIRATLATAAAMLGGANCVGASAMDSLEDERSTLGARLSRNTPLVLSLESSLGATDDPARGSYFIETLTDRIARDAWELVREIERRGGLTAAAAWARERIGSEAAARRAGVRSRALPLVGVSRFAVASPPLASPTGPTRDASDFEALRGDAHPIALWVLGDRAAVEGRASFARELIEAGGLRIVEAASEDPSSAAVAVIAAPDSLFGTEVLAKVSALAARGTDVWVLGRPGAHETALLGAGARGFVYVGSDVVDALSAMRARAEQAR